MEPEYLFLHPPSSFIHEVIFAAPPVVGSCPPCTVAFDHTADTHEDYECEDNRKTSLGQFKQAECNEEYEIQYCENYREPCILVHHGKACEIEDKLLFFNRKSYEGNECAVDQDVDIEWDDYRLDDPLLDKALKIILLGDIALKESVT